MITSPRKKIIYYCYILSFIALLVSYDAAFSKNNSYYECSPIKDDFILFRTQDEKSFTDLDRASPPLKGSPIHLNISQFDGKLFDFFSEVNDFSSQRAKGWVAFGWGTNSFDRGIYYEIEPQYWNCELEKSWP